MDSYESFVMIPASWHMQNSGESSSIGEGEYSRRQTSSPAIARDFEVTVDLSNHKTYNSTAVRGR